MKFWKKMVKAVGLIVNFRIDHWVDLQGLKNTTRYFWRQGKQLFKINHAEHPESFEEAVKRLNLTPEMLNAQKKRYLFLFLLFLIVAGVLLIYTFILVTIGNKMGALVSFSLIIYALSLAFRFHFWYFQITHKKLGCEIQEWLNSRIVSGH